MGSNNRLEEYINEIDWRVKENSNANYSFAGLQGHLANSEIVDWALKNMYAGEIAMAHDDGFFHIHDLSHAIVGYCCGHSTEDLVKEGFNCGGSFIYSKPPKHLNTFFGQLNNYLFTLSLEWAGAQAFNSVDTFSSAFIKYDNLSDDEIRREIESLVYNLNVKTRTAMQSPFTNFSFDIQIPSDLAWRQAIVGGEEQDFTYGDCQEECDRFNKIFAEVMTAGDGMGKPFTFPVVTYSIAPDFPWDTELSEKIFTFADEANSPYFSNFINSDQSPSDVRSMCVTPDTKVFALINSEQQEISIKELFDNYDEKDFQVLTAYGYRQVSKKVVIPYDGNMLKFTTDKGKKLITTPDHPHAVLAENEEVDFKLAKEVKVGDTFSCIAKKRKTSVEKIISIEEMPYNGLVYDLEIKTRNGETDNKYHTFYANGILTHNCCRLRLDLRELVKKTGGLFGAGDKTGSIGVVTLNLPKMAFIAANKDYALLEKYPSFSVEEAKKLEPEDAFFNMVDYFCDLAKDSLLIRRRWATSMIERGALPYTKKYIGNFNNHFNTIGVNGGHEACLNLYGEGIQTEKGKQLMVKTLKFILNKCADYQEKYNGLLFNLEASPAEGCILGDTLIQTTEGYIPIKDLVDRTDVKVFCYDDKNHELHIRPVNKIWKTQENAEVVKITFDNGQDLICTPNHPIAVNKTAYKGIKGVNYHIEWVPAEMLKPGDSIKSNYIRECDHGYLKTSVGDHYLHKFIYNELFGVPDGYVVHHIDGNKKNNSLENLKLMSEKEHKRYHLNERHKNGDSSILVKSGKDNPFYGKHHSDKTKAILSEKSKGRNTGDANYMRTSEGRLKMSEIAKNRKPWECSKYNHNVKDDDIIKCLNNGLRVREIACVLKTTYSVIQGRLKNMGLWEQRNYPNQKHYNSNIVGANHKVISVEKLNERYDVYNMSVEEFEDYFVGGADGILVHNCSTRFARKDKKLHPGIITGAGTGGDFYTNSTQLPDDYSENVFAVFEHQNALQPLYTSGTVQHIYMHEPTHNWKLVQNLIKKLFIEFRLPYASISPNISVCPICGKLDKYYEVCPHEHTIEQIDEAIQRGIITKDDVIEY